MRVRDLIGVLLWLTLSAAALAQEAAPSCEDCWTPKPNFDIEGHGFFVTMSFVSGIVYTLNATNAQLAEEGKRNFYCVETELDGKKMFEALNESLIGVVPSERVILTVMNILHKEFPCKETELH